jgi:hypothetical protein
MKTALCLLALAMGLTAAESPAERGKRVVYEALQALGGDAFLHMEDRLESGRAYSFYRSQLSGLSVARIYTRYPGALEDPKPGQVRLRERQSFGKKEENAVLFTEEGAWEITYRGARPLPDDRLANYRDTRLHDIFYTLRQRLKDPGLEFYWNGNTIFENRPVEIVDITGSDGVTVTVYFNQADKLPARESYKRRNKEFKDFDTLVTIYSKYRDVGGGVKWPFDTRSEKNGEKTFELFAESVEINQTLTDNFFNLPVGIRMLEKEK